jgi:histidyl-tRNA synthetase
VELLRLEDNNAPSSPHAYLVMLGEGTKPAGLALAERLRDAVPGFRVVSNAGAGSFRSQFKRADRSGAELALVLGEQELLGNRVVVKRLREEAAQEDVPVEKLAEWLAGWLKHRH